MIGQLQLWDLRVDLAAQIIAEKKAEVKIFYHFLGRPLPMHK